MHQEKKKIVMFGTGEMADMACYYMANDPGFDGVVVAFTADDQFLEGRTTYHGLPLVPLSKVTEYFPPSMFWGHVALSYNKLNQIREEKYLAMKQKGYRLASYVCSKSSLWPDLSVGENCLILENQTIQPTVSIGNNVMMWSGNHIGHGTRIGDHTYISSHVCLSGYTTVGTHCFFGVNSATRDYAKIGNGVFVAMGASITKDIESGSVVLGSKSDVFTSDTDVAMKLKRKYFNI